MSPVEEKSAVDGTSPVAQRVLRPTQRESVPLVLPLLVALAAHLLAGCGDDGGTPMDPDAGPAPMAMDGSVPDAADGSAPAPDAATPPTLGIEALAFTAYGRLELTLVEALPEGAALSVALEAEHTFVPAVVDVERLDERRFQAALDRHHLPLLYTVVARFDAQEASAEVFGEGARVAFVTREHGPANLSAWSQAGGEVALAAADAICQSEAEAAGYRGTFRAFLGGPSDPACRMLGEEGQVETSCGLDELPSDRGAILDGSGTPVLYGVDGLLADEWRLSLSRFADGEPVGAGVFAWYAANGDGTTSGTSDCAGWTGEVDRDVRGLAASSVATLPPRSGHAIPCDTTDFRDDWTLHLFCGQTATESGAPFFEAGDVHLREGKQVFLTSDSVPGDLGSLAAADDACNAAAAAAGLEGDFIAWMSDASADAYCHLLGLRGTRDGGCGGATLPESGPWVRADGYLVADDVDDLTDADGVAAPVLYDELGEPHRRGITLTGTYGDGSWIEGYDCDGWTGTGNRSGGHPRAIGDDWTRYASGACAPGPVLCFER